MKGKKPRISKSETGWSCSGTHVFGEYMAWICEHGNTPQEAYEKWSNRICLYQAGYR